MGTCMSKSTTMTIWNSRGCSLFCQVDKEQRGEREEGKCTWNLSDDPMVVKGGADDISIFHVKVSIMADTSLCHQKCYEESRWQLYLYIWEWETIGRKKDLDHYMYNSQCIIHNKYYELLSTHYSVTSIKIYYQSQSGSQLCCRIVCLSIWTWHLSFSRQLSPVDEVLDKR